MVQALLAAGADAAAQNTALILAMVKPNACWTCATCCCTNERAAAACADCRKQRPSTDRQTDALRRAATAGDAAAAIALIAVAVPLEACAPMVFGSKLENHSLSLFLSPVPGGRT